MMRYFCEVGTVSQVLLLILSLITVITLISCLVLLLRHKQNVKISLAAGAVLLCNSAMYVFMQVDSRITGTSHSLHIPYALLFAVTLLSLGLAVWYFLHETHNRKSINNTSIKESFDNLPAGVCFFNEAGLPVLCNREMHRFSFAVCGKDVQFISDLQECLEPGFMPAEGVIKEGNTFTDSDSNAWNLEKRSITHENGSFYTQYIAVDVTDLQNRRMELHQENIHLRKIQADLARLSANVVAVTREEEILNAKMQVHDEMGRCLVEARKYLSDGTYENIPESVLSSWRRAVSMLKYNNDTPDEDMMHQIRKTCESVNLRFIQRGNLPKQEEIAYTLTCAVRECVTNAVRYARASQLYVDFFRE